MAMTAQGVRAIRPNPFGTVREETYREPYRADIYRPGPAGEESGAVNSMSLVLGAAAAGGAIIGVLLALAAAWI